MYNRESGFRIIILNHGLCILLLIFYNIRRRRNAKLKRKKFWKISPDIPLFFIFSNASET